MDAILTELRAVNEDDTRVRDVEAALSQALSQLTQNAVSTARYATLLQVVVDRVAPYLSTRAADIEPACATIDALFLGGIDHVAFRALIQALRNRTHLTAARTAALFVSERAGGIRRIANVISHAAHSGDSAGKLAAELVHLPTRVSNAAFEAPNGNAIQLLDPQVHAQTITKAILRQPDARDPARDALVGALLGALARLGFAGQVISACASAEEVNRQRVSRILLLASEEYIGVYLRGALELDHSHVFAEKLCRKILRTSATARAMCVSMKPNIVLKNAQVSIARLVSALYDVLSEAEYIGTMERTARTWGAEKFAMHAQVRVQRQFTRLLLTHFRMAELKTIPADKLDCFAVVTAQGISFRLDHGDEKIRRFGMVVGEAFSRLSRDENVLKFPRNPQRKEEDADGEEGDGDSDFSDIANDDEFDCFRSQYDGNDTSDEKKSPETYGGIEQDGKSSEDITPKPEGTSHSHSRTHRRPRPVRWEFETEESGPRKPEAWELEDDWASLDSASVSSDGDSLDNDNSNNIAGGLEATRADYEAMRKLIDAPLSVARILGMLRSANSGQDDSLKYTAEIICSTLRSLASRARARSISKSGGGNVQLARSVFLIDARKYPDEDFAALEECRSNALDQLIQLDLENTAGMLIREFVCGDVSDLATKNEALSFVVQGAKKVSETRKITPQEEGKEAIASDVKQVGTVIRRSERSLALGKKSTEKQLQVNEYASCAGTIFFELANGLKTESMMKEAKFFSNGISALAALLSFAGAACSSRREMGIALMELCGRSFRHGNPSVRRACALAAGTGARALSATDISQMMSGNDNGNSSSGVVLTRVNVDIGISIGTAGSTNETFDDSSGGILDWLMKARDGDGDVLVRRFAAISLSKWTEKLQLIADGEST